jgi:hypothetical protein
MVFAPVTTAATLTLPWSYVVLAGNLAIKATELINEMILKLVMLPTTILTVSGYAYVNVDLAVLSDDKVPRFLSLIIY